MPKLSKPFLFGNSQIIRNKRSQKLFRGLAEGMLDHSCEKGKAPGLTALFTRGGSQLILVGHNIKTDMSMIDSRPEFWETLNPSAVIDLEELYGKVKLQAVLEDLRIGAQVSDKFLHCAGNDSNFTLRAVLLSVIQHLHAPESGKYLDKELRSMLTIIVLKNAPNIAFVAERDDGTMTGNKETRRVRGRRRRRRAKRELREATEWQGSRVKDLCDALEQLPEGWIESLYE